MLVPSRSYTCSDVDVKLLLPLKTMYLIKVMSPGSYLLRVFTNLQFSLICVRVCILAQPCSSICVFHAELSIYILSRSGLLYSAFACKPMVLYMPISQLVSEWLIEWQWPLVHGHPNPSI
jgi:hypothetical protein